jgi:ribosome-associated protein
MLHALAESVQEQTVTRFHKKGRVEGSADTGWIVVDYGDIVVHLFEPELRRFYKLEELWKEGKVILRVQ